MSSEEIATEEATCGGNEDVQMEWSHKAGQNKK